jgi:hypothetical protein
VTPVVYRVGDPDPTPGAAYSGGPCCSAKDPDGNGLGCSWPIGHTHPQHVAGTGISVVAVWPAT